MHELKGPKRRSTEGNLKFTKEKIESEMRNCLTPNFTSINETNIQKRKGNLKYGRLRTVRFPA